MNNKVLIIILSSLLIISVGSLVYMHFNSGSKMFRDDFHRLEKKDEKINKNRKQVSQDSCVADDCLLVSDLNYPVATLDSYAKDALNSALDDEYKAYATYLSVTKKLGNIRPFIMIIRSEEQHISSIKSLFDKYGLEIPENKYIGTINSPSTLKDACMAGVNAENKNVSLYKDNLLSKVEAYEDITLVFNKLMNASKNNHLSAFENCSK